MLPHHHILSLSTQAEARAWLLSLVSSLFMACKKFGRPVTFVLPCSKMGRGRSTKNMRANRRALWLTHDNIFWRNQLCINWSACCMLVKHQNDLLHLPPIIVRECVYLCVCMCVCVCVCVCNLLATGRSSKWASCHLVLLPKKTRQRHEDEIKGRQESLGGAWSSCMLLQGKRSFGRFLRWVMKYGTCDGWLLFCLSE